ncbi:MAG: hypothetical protein ISS57_02400 [Anaerolineales bacterium]|nr:hypothetical protein [Anaerolineales bacterium]
MTKTAFYKLSNILAPMISPQLLRLILLVGMLLASLFFPQVVFAGPSIGGVGS